MKRILTPLLLIGAAFGTPSNTVTSTNKTPSSPNNTATNTPATAQISGTSVANANACTGVAATDTDALNATIAAAGANAVIYLQPSSTPCVIDETLTLLPGQTVSGYGATIQRAAQVATTTTTTTTAGVTNSIVVANTAGMRVGQTIVLQNGPNTNYDPNPPIISSIVGNTITTATSFNLSVSGTTSVYTSGTIISTSGNRNSILGIIFDGNAANNPFGRWQVTKEILLTGSNNTVRDNYFHDTAGEGIEENAGWAGNISAGTNNITANGRTAVLDSAVGLNIGDYVMIFGTTGEPYYHRIINISTNTITIDTSLTPGWWFGAASGSVTVWKGSTGNVIDSNIMDRVNGNGIHLSASNGTSVTNNTVLNTNLSFATDSTHIVGGIGWSNGCVGTRVIGNNLDHNYYGLGTIDSVDNSFLVLSNNTIENSTVNAIEIHYAGADLGGPRSIVVQGNTLRNSAPLAVAQTSASATAPQFIQDVAIVDNQFYNTRLIIQRARGVTISGNGYNFAGDTTSTILEDDNSIQVAVTGNDFYGAKLAIGVNGTATDLLIDGNTMRMQNSYGVFSGAKNTNVRITNNSISNDATASAGSYQGIDAAGGGEYIAGNTLNLVQAYSGITVAGVAGVIVDNNFINVADAGGGHFTVRVNAGTTNSYVNDNQTNATVSNAAGAGVVLNNNQIIGSYVAPSQTISFQPYYAGALNTTKGGFAKLTKASTVDNIEVSASQFACSVNPTITLYECGTSTTCASSPTMIGSATITAAGAVVDGNLSAPVIGAGDYVAWQVSAGTCTLLNISATAQVHAN